MNYSFKFKQILPLMLALMIDNMSFSAIFPLVTSLFQEHTMIFFGASASLQWVDFVMGLAYMMMPLGMVFGASLLGDLSDIWGRGRTLTMAMVGIGVGYLLLALSVMVGSVSLFLFGRLITGLMAGSQSIAQASIIDISTPQNKSVNMSFIAFAVSLGFTLGPVIAALFSTLAGESRLGFELPFMVIALGAFIGAVWIWLGYDETFKKNKTKKMHPMRAITIFADAFKDRCMRILAPGFALYQIGIFIFFTTVLLKLQSEFSYHLGSLGWFSAYTGLWMMVSMILIIPKTIMMMSAKRWAYWGTAVNGIFGLVLAFTISEVVVWIFSGLFIVANSYAYIAILTLFSNASDKHNQGWAMGIAIGFAASSFIFGSLLMSLLPQLGADNLLAISGLAILISSAIYLYYGKMKGAKKGATKA